MTECPVCGKWTLDFDEYFARFRCFNAECGWMPASSAERETSLLRSHQQPRQIDSKRIEELNLTIASFYDPKNDAIVFDFGLKEPMFDVPEGDGRMVWRMGRHTGSVAGFSIFRAKEFDVSKITVNIEARKETLEETLRRTPDGPALGRATRTLIRQVLVRASESRPAVKQGWSRIQDAVNESLAKFKSDMLPRLRADQAAAGA